MRFAAFVLVAFLGWVTVAVAQDSPVPDEAFAGQSDWVELADRVEAALERGQASNTAFAQLRSELVEWRDIFLEDQSVNATRIETVNAQIAALGAVPEDGDEDPRVAARRAVLNDQLRTLTAPVRLAEEAYIQADGLIGEIDVLFRERQADRFTERSQSPLNPGGWASTAQAVSMAMTLMGAEITAAIAAPTKWSAFVDALPLTLVLSALALVLVVRGRAWFNRLSGAIVSHTARGRGVVAFVLSLGQILMPFLGLLALSAALQSTGLLGRRTEAIVAAIPMLGLFPILAHWLAGQLLPKDADVDWHPMMITAEVSARAHRRFITLGYWLMLFGFAALFVEANTFDADTSAIVMFPFGVIMCWTLYWVGHSLRRPPAEGDVDPDAPRSFRVALRLLLSRGVMVTAVVGVVLAAMGYSKAFDALPHPAAMTLYVLGVLVLLQRLSVDAYTLLSKSDNGAQDALMPVLIGFLLVLLAIPILAVIWGAQVTDLTEIWARFREGFSIGETRISPTNFLLFALVFVVGYTVTRLVQSALRTTVLPRTKLDAGAQNAVVSGLGYVGIFMAAVIAITTAGIDLSGLAIVAGALSVGIGFGMQNIVSNFVSGIILLIERPISAGDMIEVGGKMGFVRDISVRSTRIETFDRTDVIVPNADLVSNQVTNWTRGNNVGRAIVQVGVAYGTDVDRVMEILGEIAQAQPMVLLNPPPGVLFIGFGADSLDFEIRAIIRDVNYVMVVKSEINTAIAKRFVEEGIEIPFGQRDIWLRNPEVLKPVMPRQETSKDGAPEEDTQ